MRTDFENIDQGQAVTLYPNERNMLHSKPVTALFSNGYFFCYGSNHEDGPDYYFGDVSKYNDGFDTIPNAKDLIRKEGEPTAVSKRGSK